MNKTKNDTEPKYLDYKEVFKELTIEEITAKFFDKEALNEIPYKLFQLNTGNERFYYVPNEYGEPKIYPSVTTVISKTLIQSPYLIQWVAEKGIEEAEKYKKIRASYGTFMHAEFESILINFSYNFDTLKDRLKLYIDVNRLPDDFIYYEQELKKDILSFIQFVKDYDVKPLFIEVGMKSDLMGVAGLIDLVANIKISPNKDKRINVIVDFKSGKKGFYESNIIQLGLYERLFKENFPDIKIDKLYNFSPNDWRINPTYKFTDQTDNKALNKINALLELASIDVDTNKNFMLIHGSINLNEPVDLNKNILSLSISDLVKSRNKKDIKKAKKVSKKTSKKKESKQTGLKFDKEIL